MINCGGICCRVVLWPRIDQKTCLKAIVSAGFEAVVINNTLEGDEVRTDLAALEAEVHNRGAAAVACIVTTTSCFAPRGADKIVEVVCHLTFITLSESRGLCVELQLLHHGLRPASYQDC